MALQRQVIPVNLAGGLDTKTDPFSLSAGRSLTLENAVFTTPQALRKRFGYTALGAVVGVPPSGTLTVGQAIAAYMNELLLFDRATVYSWDAASLAWLFRGVFVSCNVTQRPVVRNSYQQTQQDGTTHPSGLQAYAWEDSSGGSRYSVIDTATGQAVIANALISATAIKPKVVSIGNFIVLLYVNTADSRIYAAAISISTPLSPLSPIAISASAGNTKLNATSPNFDAAAVNTTSGQQLYVAYNDSTPTTGGITMFAAPSGAPTTFGGTVVVLAEPATVINVFGDNFKQGPVVAWYNGTAVKYKAYDSALATSYGTGTVETVGSVELLSGASTSSTALSLRFFYSISAAATYNHVTRQNTVAGAYAVGTASVFRRSTALAGKAFVYNSIAYVPLAYQSPLQPSYFVIDHNGTIIAKILYALGGGIPVRGSLGSAMLAESSAVNATTFRLALLAKGSLSVQSGAVFTLTGVMAVTLNLFDTQNSYLRAEMGGSLHLSGGFVSMYDGISIVEHGFHLFPEPVTVATSTSGGSIGAGTYQYVVCYAWMDAQGNLHRSAPSVAISQTTTGATSSNTITIPTLRLTAKQTPRGPVSLEVYRTQNNLTTFYQVSSITSPTLNDPTVDTVNFVDTLADASIAGNALLYTTGNVVENISPNAIGSLTVHRNRIFALDTTDGSFWYSKQVVPGAPVEFSDLFRLVIDPRGGVATAGAGMDDKLIVFKKTSIFFHSGQGPDATGGQNDFSDSVLVTLDVGTANPRSIVLSPEGLLFQTAKGIYLLDRGLSLSYVGAPVEAFNSSNVTSAQIVPGTNQVRFTLDTGVALVYDYFMRQWSVFTNHNAVDATVWNGVYTYLTPGGIAMQETPGAFGDAGNYIRIRVVTGWLQFAGVQGFQRVYKALLLGQYISPHKLRVQVAYDFNSPIQEDYVLPAAPGTYGSGNIYGAPSAYGGVPLYQWCIYPVQQKCEAIQFTIEDVSTGTIGEALSLSWLGLEVGSKGRLHKLPAAASYG